jgi:nucleoside-diphosphate-sugar epimerase
MEGFDPNRGYQAYNIGRSDLMSMEHCARLICQLADQPDNLIEVSEPGRFVTRVKNASFDKAREHFGYVSEIPVEEGVRRTIDWQRQVVFGGGIGMAASSAAR